MLSENCVTSWPAFLKISSPSASFAVQERITLILFHTGSIRTYKRSTIWLIICEFLFASPLSSPYILNVYLLIDAVSDDHTQVLLDAFDQQTGHGIHWSRDLCMEHVPTTLLGLLPRRRLFPQTVRSGIGWRRERKERIKKHNPASPISFARFFSPLDD